ncbi:MAG TPA: 23S rRNA (uracil(1939)-C(5))-methyltransferase RlmD [Caldithrix sp.]|nr:23S rRNA (uracil(1939)-C(5))-methyltransferase RlmD [Caldithrix sp.]
MKMRKKQQLEITIDKLAFGGKGIGHSQGKIIFVDRVIPGDRVLVRIRRVKRNYLEARVLKLLEPSPLRKKAPCEHFGSCGGCKWQNLDYAQQLSFKREQVVESLQHIGLLDSPKVAPVIPSPLQFQYRNKMEFSFTDSRWLSSEELSDPANIKDFAIGLHVPGAFDRVMQIDTCWLQDEVMNEILNFSQEYFRRSALPVFNLKTHQGLLRFLVLRKSFAYNTYMVNIVTFRAAEQELRQYTELLTQKIPGIVSVINTVNPRVAQIAFGEDERLLFGEKALKEKLGHFEFEISANSFFQTNPLQAVNLFQTVQEFVEYRRDLIWDLYSGTGTIGLFLSEKSKRVVGFELVDRAVQDAYRNCRKNGVSNCEFVSGDIRTNLSEIREKPDVIVCDPPRSGMHPDVVKMILQTNTQTIVYVSCNPTTMARDLKILVGEYRLVKVQPVDMFPHTYHIETVAKLERT